MRRHHPTFRLAAVAAVTGLAATVIPAAALAQAPLTPPEAVGGADVNPPARVGALTLVRGTVSFHAAGADTWSPAELNYPVTTGEGFWTQPGAEARIDVSDTRVWMAGATELDVATLDATNWVATLPQGEVYLDVLDLQPGETYTVLTPRGAVTIAAAGQYSITAGDTSTPTVIAALSGEATLGEGVTGDLHSGQAAQITGDAAPFQMQIVAAEPDDFVQHVLSESQPAPPAQVQTVAPPPLVARMPGGAALAEYGTWTPSPQYGEIWYPQVSREWVPYREGHWAYVAPWGWTWVDSDAWGFAPFHYGRWIDQDGRWGWVPGYSEPIAEGPDYPVYAPALVTFFGVGLAAGVGAALYNGSVGWVPLGPDEAYRPWFRSGPQYIRDVNIRHVRNLTQITEIINNRTTINNVTINRFRDSPGATLVPAAAMAGSRPLAGLAQRPSAQALALARPVIGREPIRPSTATAGVTPALAREVKAAPAPEGAPRHREAPGPEISRGALVGTAAVGGAAVAGAVAAHHLARPPLVRPGAPGTGPRGPESSARPEARSAVVGEHPGPATPTLRVPGAGPPAHPLQGEHIPGDAHANLPGPAPGAKPELHAAPGEPSRAAGQPITPEGRAPESRGPTAPERLAPTHTTPSAIRPEPARPGVPTAHTPELRPPAVPERLAPTHTTTPAIHPEPARPAAPAAHTPGLRPSAAPERLAPAHITPPAIHPESARPTTTPAYHPEPARPAAPAYHPEPVRPTAPAYHPEPARPTAPAYHPEPVRPTAPAYHPEPPRPAAPAYHPEPPRPAAPAYHPEPPRPAAPAYHPEPPRPAAPAYHPEPARPAAPAYHPESPRPAPAVHPAPRPAPRPAQEQRRPG